MSKDKTQEICLEFDNVEVVEHAWPGNQAEQFNWALDNLKIDTGWIFRLDADEYLTLELIDELRTKLPTMPKEVSACVLPLGRAFMGRVLKHGIVNGVSMIRLFRKGKARYEVRMMDEHLQVLEGETITLEHKFIDASLLSLKQFTDKHNNYSSKEAVQLLDAEYGLTEIDNSQGNYAKVVALKRAQKAKYARMPIFWRSFAYFCYRYFIKLGFLDGKEGFLWDFFQGLWYRMLVDAKVYEAKKACGDDKEKIKTYIENNWQIKL